MVIKVVHHTNLKIIVPALVLAVVFAAFGMQSVAGIFIAIAGVVALLQFLVMIADFVYRVVVRKKKGRKQNHTRATSGEGKY